MSAPAPRPGGEPASAVPAINRVVLMSDAAHFRVEELNPYSHRVDQPDPRRAVAEHEELAATLASTGVEVRRVPSPEGCQDGIYVANWALCRGGRAVMARLPNLRESEEPYARRALSDLGQEIALVPEGRRFSGQGDALFCGDLLLAGSGYRTDADVHPLLADVLGVRVVGLRTVPVREESGRPVVNATTGWPDSLFYDLDLALAVLTPELIAWCPDAFTPESRAVIRTLPLERIEVSWEEAVHDYACNLVSTGDTVVLNGGAVRLREAVEAAGLRTIGLRLPEIAKGGGYIRCTTLTLD